CCADPRDVLSFPTRRSSDLINDLPFAPALYLFQFFFKLLLPLSRLLRYPLIVFRYLVFELLLRKLLRPAYHIQSGGGFSASVRRSEEHTSELQSRENLVCRL